MEQLVVCRACGHQNHNRDTECRSCGKRLFTFDPTLESGVEVATTTPGEDEVGKTTPSGSERTEAGRMAVDSTDVPIEAVAGKRRRAHQRPWDDPAYRSPDRAGGQGRGTSSGNRA